VKVVRSGLWSVTAPGAVIAQMMDHDDWWWGGWGIGMGLGMLLFWIIVIALGVWLFRWLAEESRARRGPEGRDSALEILRERYARGEISREEFEDKKRGLT